MGKSSSNSKTHPYYIPRNWTKPAFQFWECDSYSEKSKEYFRNRVKIWNEREKSLNKIDSTL